MYEALKVAEAIVKSPFAVAIVALVVAGVAVGAARVTARQNAALQEHLTAFTMKTLESLGEVVRTIERIAGRGPGSGG